MSFIEFIKRVDTFFFLLMNHDSFHQYLDMVMIVLRNPYTWIPLYIFLIWYFFRKAGRRTAPFILFTVLNVAITDSFSNLLKNIFERIRPCYDADISGMVKHLVDCGGAYSFPSSHAANHFGLAAFWFWTLFKLTGKKWKWLWIWAALISYAQIYVGIHYPSDIVAGALLGILIGSIIAKVFELFLGSKLSFQKISFNLTGNRGQN